MNPDDLEVVAGCIVAHPDQRGGQHVARACTDVMVIHRPTGIAVRCGEHRSQYKNREAALARLRLVVALYENSADGDR